MIKPNFESLFGRRKGSKRGTGDAGVGIEPESSSNQGLGSVDKISRRWSVLGSARPSDSSTAKTSVTFKPSKVQRQAEERLNLCNRIPSDHTPPPPTTYLGETDTVDRIQAWVELEREVMAPGDDGAGGTKTTLVQRRIRVATFKNLDLIRVKKMALCKCLSYALARGNSGRGEHGQGRGNEEIRLMLLGMKQSWFLPSYLSSPAVLKLLSCNLEAGALVPLVSGLEMSEKEEVLKTVCELGLTTFVEAVLVSGFEITNPLLWQTLLPEAIKKGRFDLAMEILLHPKTDVNARLTTDWGPVDFRPALLAIRWPGGQPYMTQLMRHPKINLLRKPVVLKAIVDLDPNALQLLVNEGRPQ